jgi:hypothetical protein
VAARGSPAPAAGHVVAGSCLGHWAVPLACREATAQRTFGEEREFGVSLMGSDGLIDLDEAMEHRVGVRGSAAADPNPRGPRRGWIVVLVALSDFDGASMPQGMEDCSKLPRIAEALLRKGYSEDDIRKILGGNLLRVMTQKRARMPRDATTAYRVDRS